MNARSYLGAAALAAVLGLSGAAMAQPSIPWYTIDGGGGTSTGGAFSLSGTIGQADASGPMTGGNFSLTGGYWGAVRGTPACNLADITEIGGTDENPGNPDGQLTVDDLILFVNLFSSGTGCPGAAPCNRADVTGIGGLPEAPDGQLTVDDLIEFVNAFSAGC